MFAAGAVIAVEDDRRLYQNGAIRELRLERRFLRDTSNPFTRDPEHFRKFYRLTPDMALQLVDRLSDELQPHKVDGVPPYLQVLCAVRFYAEGAYQKGVGQDMEHPVSQTMVSRIIERVTNGIVAMADEFIHFPRTREERQQCALGFRNKIRIPGILGLIDCFLVAFVRPTENEEAFFNYKGYHAMNVQVVVDANYIIRNVRICPGSNNDRNVWLHSDMKEHMEMLRADREIRRTEGRYYLLGWYNYVTEL